MTVITRFAPSPTGYLHIGGARTALFNYLFAKHHKGKFLLRIEDTDRERSTKEAEAAIIDGLKWLGLQWDGEVYYQHKFEKRHAEVAAALLKNGHAYYCYATPEELKELREKKLPYDRRWRDCTASDAPKDIKPAVRLKAPLDKDIVINDIVRGEVKTPAGQLEDLVILRSDGTPTYNLAVVADDHDMGVTHVIRGEDHLTNAAKQKIIYEAMGWSVPVFAHIPLIHGADGAKMSKRHGAVGVDAYRDMGYLPEALRNYLLRLGWAHGDDEIISDQQAVEWFSLEAVGQSPSRFDFAKLDNLNAHYIKEASDERLVSLLLSSPLGEIFPPPVGGPPPLHFGEPVSTLASPERSAGGRSGGGHVGHDLSTNAPTPTLPLRGRELLLRAMPGLKSRARTLKELAENAAFYVAARPLALDAKAQEILDKGGRDILRALLPKLESLADFSHANIECLAREFAEASGQKLGQVAQPLRSAVTGKTVSPPIFEAMEALGKAETLGRIRDVC